MIRRKYIKPGTHLSFRLSASERDLVVERALLDPEIEARLRAAPASGSKLVFELTLDDLDDLHGCVAAEAGPPKFTPKQGQYLAFIYYFTFFRKGPECQILHYLFHAKSTLKIECNRCF
jgi:hypothetical protein